MTSNELKKIVDRAKKGNEEAVLEIINMFQPSINKRSFGNEDCKQYIIEQIIIAIRNFKY